MEIHDHIFSSVSERKNAKCTKLYPSRALKQAGQTQVEQPCEYYIAILSKMLHVSVTSSNTRSQEEGETIDEFYRITDTGSNQ